MLGIAVMTMCRIATQLHINFQILANVQKKKKGLLNESGDLNI